MALLVFMPSLKFATARDLAHHMPAPELTDGSACQAGRGTHATWSCAPRSCPDTPTVGTSSSSGETQATSMSTASRELSQRLINQWKRPSVTSRFSQGSNEGFRPYTNVSTCHSFFACLAEMRNSLERVKVLDTRPV